MALYLKYTRALTFEKCLQGLQDVVSPGAVPGGGFLGVCVGVCGRGGGGGAGCMILFPPRTV